MKVPRASVSKCIGAWRVPCVVIAALGVMLASAGGALAMTVVAGYDYWETPWPMPPDGSQVDFPPGVIPPDFFGPGSDPFDGVIYLTGEPIDPELYGDMSTLVERLTDVDLPNDGDSGTVETQMVELNLVSTEPITVTFDSIAPGLWAEYMVTVTLDKDAPPSLGSMDITRNDGLGGGTFAVDSFFDIYVKIEFWRWATNYEMAAEYAVLPDPYEPPEPFLLNGAVTDMWSETPPGEDTWPGQGPNFFPVNGFDLPLWFPGTTPPITAIHGVIPPRYYCPVPDEQPWCYDLQPWYCEQDDVDQECLPNRVQVWPPDGFYVEECDCFFPWGCGAVHIDPVAGEFSCPGPCPDPTTCQIHVNGVATGQGSVSMADLADGEMVTCDCAEPQQELCPVPAGEDWCIPLQSSDCVQDDVDQDCLPKRVQVVLAVPPFYVEECDCFFPWGCGAVAINQPVDGELSCPGDCDHTTSPTDFCQIHLGDPGIPTGQVSIPMADIIGQMVTCDCAEPQQELCPLFPMGASCAALQMSDCEGDASEWCMPRVIYLPPTGGDPVVEVCDCFGPDGCGAVLLVGQTFSCPGDCDFTANPDDICQLHVDGNPTGKTQAEAGELGIGNVTCQCDPFGVTGCCRPGGACSNELPENCIAMGGTVQPTPCAGYLEACCYQDDPWCVDMDPVCCDDEFGTPSETGAGCAFAAIGCCYQDDPWCLNMDLECCGVFGGETSPTNDPCEGDVSGNGIDDACECLDVVVCEPQAGQPNHPPTYWYDVTPEDGCGGRCDFHVRVYDPNVGNYSNPSLPAASWQFVVHMAGADEWWASWYDPECQNPIYGPATTRFQFTNNNPVTWGEWRTTNSASPDPNAGIVDSTANHMGQSDGYGRNVHVPEYIPQELCPLPMLEPPWCEGLWEQDCVQDGFDQTCLPKVWLNLGPGMLELLECDCFSPGGCGPVSRDAEWLFCEGVCVPPTDLCQIHINGEATGMPMIHEMEIPPESLITCDCPTGVVVRPMPVAWACYEPDFCDYGPTCMDDCDCGPDDPGLPGCQPLTEAYCIPDPGNTYPGKCYGPQARYLSIARNPDQVDYTARKVCLDDMLCIGWVGEPFESVEVAGMMVAYLVGSPYYEQQWPEELHVTDCRIVPSHTYYVEACVSPAGVADCSEPLELRTPTLWGDVVFTCRSYSCLAPQGEVNIDDILASIGAFQSANKNPLTWFDLTPNSAPTHVPEQMVLIDDILAIIEGFQSKQYPGDGPDDCPPYPR